MKKQQSTREQAPAAVPHLGRGRQNDVVHGMAPHGLSGEEGPRCLEKDGDAHRAPGQLLGFARSEKLRLVALDLDCVGAQDGDLVFIEERRMVATS